MVTFSFRCYTNQSSHGGEASQPRAGEPPRIVPPFVHARLRASTPSSVDSRTESERASDPRTPAKGARGKEESLKRKSLKDPTDGRGVPGERRERAAAGDVQGYVARNTADLPEGGRAYEIAGGNHEQYGSYGSPGLAQGLAYKDLPATISGEAQCELLAAAIDGDMSACKLLLDRIWPTQNAANEALREEIADLQVRLEEALRDSAA